MGRFLYDLRGYAATGATFGFLYAVLHGLLSPLEIGLATAIGTVGAVVIELTLHRPVRYCAALPPERRATLYARAHQGCAAAAAVVAGFIVYDVSGKLFPSILAVLFTVLTLAALASDGRASRLRPPPGATADREDSPSRPRAAHWTD